jgi:hypothetical protein
MKKKEFLVKKVFFLISLVSLVCFITVGCASTPASAMLGPGNFYSDSVTVGVRRGEATGTVFLGIFGTISYPSVEQVAMDYGITRIATVEHYSKPGLFFLWTEYTTIVTGE